MVKSSGTKGLYHESFYPASHTMFASPGAVVLNSGHLSMSEFTETFLCLGPSQWPIVRNGSEVRISPATQLRAGELVVFSGRGTRICHRLLKSKREGEKTLWLTKGDANLNADGWIAENQIAGRVIAVNGRSVNHLAFSVASFLLFSHSWIQHHLYQFIFFSRVGKKIGLLRIRFIPRPIFIPLYRRLSAPWNFLSDRKWILRLHSALINFTKPPQRIGLRLVLDNSDYGYAYLYEDLFCRNDGAPFHTCRIAGSPPVRALDLGGGHGRITFALAEKGADVCLVDNSKTMLESAGRRRLKLDDSVKNRVTLVEQDIRRLELNTIFDRIFSVNNGLEHVGGQTSVVETLKRLRSHLSEKGEMFVEVHRLAFWEASNDWKTGVWENQGEGIAVSDRKYDLYGRTLPGKKPAEVVWEHAISTHRFRWKLLHTTITLFSQEEWEAMFQTSAWRVEDCWGAWNGTKASDALPKVIFRLTPK